MMYARTILLLIFLYQPLNGQISTEDANPKRAIVIGASFGMGKDASQEIFQAIKNKDAIA